MPEMTTEQFDLHASIEDTHWWFAGRRRIVSKLIRSHSPPSEGITIVDIGCGTGGMVGALVREYDCVGLDPSREAVSMAQARFPQAQFICGNDLKLIGDLKERPNLYLLLDVLEHLLDDSRFFSEFVGSVAPGSSILLTVPADMTLWSPHDINYGHYRRYDKIRLAHVWFDLPVEVLLFSHFNTTLYPLVKAVRFFTQLRGRSWGSAGTDLSLPPLLVNKCLTTILGREADRVVNILQGRRERGFSFGVSLIALLKKTGE
jgi:2-polyprenyl-3-methyl-5-hydroxy-6-metoxy-1,4-benzoquinol methylase